MEKFKSKQELELINAKLVDAIYDNEYELVKELVENNPNLYFDNCILEDDISFKMKKILIEII